MPSLSPKVTVVTVAPASHPGVSTTDPKHGSSSLSLLVTRGREALSGGDHAAALDAFRKALAIAPCDPEVLFGLGQALLRLSQVDVALGCLDKAHSLAPARWDLARLLVHVVVEHNRAADAQDRLARVLEAAPDCVEALYASLMALPMIYSSLFGSSRSASQVG